VGVLVDNKKPNVFFKILSSGKYVFINQDKQFSMKAVKYRAISNDNE